tara:strand:- start:1177 stop:2742 length:1566 start_codon:yes stop_codon:yes gene_type:complete
MRKRKLAIPAFLYSFFSFVSRLSGYLRDFFLAAFLGTSVISDIFLIAFRIPNSFRRGLSEETFNPAYIPLYGKLNDIYGHEEAVSFSANILLLFIIFFGLVVFLGEIYMPEILYFFSFGIDEEENFSLLVTISRIIFPYVLILAISSVILGNLNANNRFALSGAFPAIMNLFIVLAISLFTYFNESKILYLAYSVIFAGLVQLAILMLHLRTKVWSIVFRTKFNFSFIKDFFSLYWPTLLASTFFQINLVIGILICSFQEGAVSYIYYAERLFFFPVTLVGVAIGIVLVPNISNALRSKSTDNAIEYLRVANKYTLIIILPTTAILLALSNEIVSFLFERGEFGPESSKNTSIALMAFLAGLPAATLVKIFTPYLFAIEQPKIYLKAAFYSNSLNLVLMLILFNSFGFIGIPIALSLSNYALILMLMLEHRKSKIFVFDLSELKQFLIYFILSISIYCACKFTLEIHYLVNLKSFFKIATCGIVSATIFVNFLYFFERELFISALKLISNTKVFNLKNSTK